MPDILLFHNGRCTGIELKTETGKLSKDQTAMALRLFDAGVRVYVCINVDDVMGVLERESLPRRPIKTEAA